MDQPKEEHAIAGEGGDRSPPSAKTVRRCVQSKLSWHRPRDEEATISAIEEEKGKCEDVEGEGKKKGKSRAKTPKKELKSSQSKLPWHNSEVEEAKVTVIEEREKPAEGEDEERKTRKKRKSQTKTPQKSPAKNKEPRRLSARNKGNKNCEQLRSEQITEETPKESPSSRCSEHSESVSRKSLNMNDCENVNTCRPFDLRLEAKIAAEENLRLSVGKQTHPFFTSRKAAKRLPEDQEIKKMDKTYWPGLDGDYVVSCPPIHVFDKLKDNIASIDWNNWEFAETCISNLNGYCHIEKTPSVFDGLVKPLMLNDLHREGMNMGQLSKVGDGQSPSIASGESISVDGQQLDEARFSRNISPSLEQNCRSDNSENKRQDRLLSGRLTSYYQRINCWPECSLWTNKYQPENALEVCGNNDSVNFLSEWLKSWSERVHSGSSKRNIVKPCSIESSEDSTYEIDSDMDDDETTLKNVLLITGPVGSGKSAAIYACAKEQGFEVIEVNTSDIRNGAQMKQEFGQAMDSHALNRWSAEDPNGRMKKHIFDLLSSPPDIGEDEELGTDSIEMVSRSCKQDVTEAKGFGNALEKVTTCQTADKTLILFEDVDTVFDEDHGFTSSILHLAKTAKRPIILTSNYRNPVLPQLLDRLVLDFLPPSSEELLSHLCMICASEKAYVPLEMLERLVRCCLGDIRKILMILQFWCQGKGLQTDQETQDRHGPVIFDTDAAYLAMPRLIPWGLHCKLSEKVGEEIDKAIAMREENLQQEEKMSLELNSMEMSERPKQNEAEVASPIRRRKRALFKKNSSSIEGAEFLDWAGDIEDFSNISDFPGVNGVLRAKRRSGIVMSSQSDDGSTDEHPITETVNGQEMHDVSTIPTFQTSEVLNLLELPSDHFCEYGRENAFRQPLEHFETTSVSHVCDTFKLQDMSCVPESSFTFGTGNNREDDSLAISSHSTSFILADSINSIHGLPGDTNYLDRTIDELRKCLEDNADNTSNIDVESVSGNEEQKDLQDEDDSTSFRCLLMDECSRADFSMRLLTNSTVECSPEIDLVQETWKSLRCGCDDLKSYLSANRKDVSLTMNHVAGVADLISEADIMFKSFYPLANDILQPSMVPLFEPEICSFYEEQWEMGSTYAQHGLCFYASEFREVGSSLGHADSMDLATEILASSMNTMALGNQLSKGSASENLRRQGSLHIPSSGCSIPTGREMESELCDAIVCTVPARLSMAPRDFAFHEYVSFLCKLARLECSRISQTTGRRKRSRHYLSYGSTSLSDEQIQLLSRVGCFKNLEVAS